MKKNQKLHLGRIKRLKGLRDIENNYSKKAIRSSC